MSDLSHALVAQLFHDRAPMAWFIVAAYVVALVLTFRASRAASKRERRFWIGTTWLLAFLGINKELDLQRWLTIEGRSFAQRTGWYDERRLVQGLFLMGMAIAGALTIAALVRWLRRSPAQVKIAAVGIVILFAFVLMRAGSFHHLDDWLTVKVGGTRSGWLFELSGIFVIGLAALASRMRSKRR